MRNYNPQTLERLHSISLLLANDLKILDFILDDHRSCLDKSIRSLLKSPPFPLSETDQLLIKAAYDFWDGTGGAKLNDLLSGLDAARYECLGFALAVAKGGGAKTNPCLGL